MRLIDEEYTRRPFYGSPKMTVYLRRLGHQVNHKRVERLMHKMGLQALRPRPFISQKASDHQVYPYDSNPPWTPCVSAGVKASLWGRADL